MFVLIRKKAEIKLTNEQVLALEHEGSDLLISAGAGSGKTSVLTDRIVQRICGNDNSDDNGKDKVKDISRMLVVTYTKDAANELKVRIAKKLSARLKKDPSNRHISSQLAKLGSADISTIHSFCLKCIRPHFDKFGLDCNIRIGEDSELDPLKLEAMNEVIDSFYEQDEADKDFLLVADCYSRYSEEEKLSSSLIALHKNLTSCPEGLEVLLKPTLDTDDIMTSKYARALINHIFRIVKHYKPYVSAIYGEIVSDIENNKKYESVFAEYSSILGELENALKSPKYDVFQSILKDFPQGNLRSGKKTAVPTVDVDFLTYIHEGLKNELKDLKSTYFAADKAAIATTVMQNEKMCRSTYKILSLYEKSFQEKKRKRGVCDFDDLEKMAYRLFYDQNGNLTEEAKEIRKKYDEVYVDEYQDVSAIQDCIFKAVSKGYNRFMVGDIKQSVYRFRAAEPELFSDYRDSFTELTKENKDSKQKTPRKLFMSDNFRCDPDVIKTANHVSDFMFFNSKGFTYVEGDRLKGSKSLIVSDERYDEAEKLLKEDYFKSQEELDDFVTYKPQVAEMHIINKQAFDDSEFPKELDPQAEYVAQKISGLIGKELSNGSKIKPGSIAILLKKASGAIDKYIEALDRYGIKHEYIQEISFFEKPHISLLLSILHAVDNPKKDVHLTGAMHSHIFGFSLDELILIKKPQPEEYDMYTALTNYAGDGDLEIKVTQFLQKLDTCRNEIRKMSADEAVSYIMNSTGYLSFCNKEERRDAIKLYDMARSYEQGSYKGLYSFLRHIDEIAEKGIKETVTSDPNDSVKIQTMHKSKGLEYEVCFLCDTEKGYFGNNRKPDIYYNRQLGICGYVSRDGGVVKYDNLLRHLADLTNKESDKEEAMRLLYVAMTRARCKLYIVATEDDGGKARAKAVSYPHLADEYTCYGCDSHFKLIYNACSTPLDFIKIRDNITPDDLVSFDEENMKKLSTDGDKEKRVIELRKKLRSRFDFKYGYEHLSKIPSKLSVSTLYPGVLDDEENKEYAKKSKLDSLPSFLPDEKHRATGAEKGTATHVFLQFCSFKDLYERGFEYELDRLKDKGFISEKVAALVSKESIELFRKSQTLQSFLSAKEMMQEFRFNVMLGAESLVKDPHQMDERLKEEKVLVQGVVDCLYETQNGELVLVDYKTDRVTRDEDYKKILLDKHTNQLMYYKMALTEMFGREISKVIIYSVPLGEEIEVK